MAGFCGFCGWGVGGGLSGFEASTVDGGLEKVESVWGLARTVCVLLISLWPKDKIVSRVRGLINRAKLTSAEIAKAIANPQIDSSSFSKLSAVFSTHWKIFFLCIFNVNFLMVKITIKQLTLVWKYCLIFYNVWNPNIYVRYSEVLKFSCVYHLSKKCSKKFGFQSNCIFSVLCT